MTDKNEKGLADKIVDAFEERVNLSILNAKTLYYIAQGYSLGEDCITKAKYGYTKKEIDTELLRDFNYKDKSPENLKKFKQLVSTACKIDSKYLEKNAARLALNAQTKEQIEFLAQSGLDFRKDLGTTSKGKGTALHIALQNKEYAKAQALLEIGCDPNDIYRPSFQADAKAEELCIKYGADAHGKFREAVTAGKYASEIKANKTRVKKNMERLGIKPQSDIRTELKNQKGSTGKNNAAAAANYRIDNAKAKKAKTTAQNATDKTKEPAKKQTTLTSEEIIRQNSGNSLG